MTDVNGAGSLIRSVGLFNWAVEMSVIATYARVSEPALEALRNNPNWMEALHGGGLQDAEVIDIDKACDGIVWLLARMPPPPAPAASMTSFALNRSLAPLLSGAGGRKERSLEAPYGPASALDSHQVREISTWLSGVDTLQLRARYNPEAMAKGQVYPEIWMAEGMAAFEDYLLPRFSELRTFIAAAAGAGQCVLVFFT
jgi:uncharacterized protein DUF1877